jgi:pimeloyl-ACP methyl ester carboxylesterase
LSAQGKLMVAEGSGHYLLLERPQLVIDAIAEVVMAARTTQDRARFR